jgi:hypothetical protein
MQTIQVVKTARADQLMDEILAAIPGTERVTITDGVRSADPDSLTVQATETTVVITVADDVDVAAVEALIAAHVPTARVDARAEARQALLVLSQRDDLGADDLRNAMEIIVDALGITDDG